MQSLAWFTGWVNFVSLSSFLKRITSVIVFTFRFGLLQLLQKKPYIILAECLAYKYFFNRISSQSERRTTFNIKLPINHYMKIILVTKHKAKMWNQGKFLKSSYHFVHIRSRRIVNFSVIISFYHFPFCFKRFSEVEREKT